jgi:probable rRNA maturation factor
MARVAPLPALRLSLQFGAFPGLARHRAALPRHGVMRCIRHALEQDAEITVRIVGIDEGRALNRNYRHKDHATNVLTFDYSVQPVLADLVLCGPVVEQEARRQRKRLRVHYAHLLVHGTLHAQGYDHEIGAAEARIMEARESWIMLGLGLSDPYGR